MNKSEIKQILIDFLTMELGVDDDQFGPTSDLFEGGYVESIHLETFFGFIEQTFAITLEDDHFFDERAATAAGLAEMVAEIIRAK